MGLWVCKKIYIISTLKSSKGTFFQVLFTVSEYDGIWIVFHDDSTSLSEYIAFCLYLVNDTGNFYLCRVCKV